MAEASAFSLKRLLVGKPIPSHLAHHERLSRITGLAVLSSDPLSSVAYATDFILTTLVLAGASAFWYAIPISLVIGSLLAIVVFSYQQTIHAYPNGGGSYIVAKDNLGTVPGLTAGAALLIDYVLTVSVSIAAGVAAIVAAFPALNGHQVGLSLGFILLLTVANLRGLKESGTVFMVPTYSFLFCLYALMAVGFFRYFNGTLGH